MDSAGFPEDLTKDAFRTTDGGEFGWTRAQVPRVVAVLREQSLAILGGELWWVPERGRELFGSIPQKDGVEAYYNWETERRPNEGWQAFVHRCAEDSIQAAADLPRVDDLPTNLAGRVLYNLTWVSEAESAELGRRPSET